jgi:hypothetical protein
MKFEDAVKRSIRTFMNGKVPSETAEMKEDGLFFTPEYFDDLEKILLDDEPKSNKEPVDEDV